VIPNTADGFQPVSSLADNSQIRLRGEEGLESLAEDGVVFSKHDIESFLHGSLQRVGPCQGLGKIQDVGFEYGVLTLFTTWKVTSKVVAAREARGIAFLRRKQDVSQEEGLSLKIMLVEDDEGFRRSLAGVLASRFPSVVIWEAGDGSEALDKVASFSPQIIFMDIKLPGQNGLEIARRIKVLHPDIDVIILTSYDFPEYREAARAVGAYGFLSKGLCTADEIQNLVEGLWTKQAS